MDGFDEFLHVPARLSVVALLAPADWVEFAFVRDAVGTSDSALSKQLTALANAGYVTVKKGRDGGVRRTHVRLTLEGRAAFARHAAALERIVAAARPAPDREEAT
ncbi:transcriptional regulator [Actinomadura sp. WMMB 499]|uniref:transcriptional regulator n=1 Tax=Actinomadura sp. WMMB 499 TaxID=1219491 RepID=UPI001C3F76F9|nr:transcriptional regulator [Actinomadura sp. WMMB 499]